MLKELYILRHGVAEERDRIKYPDDSVRPLTPDGRRKMAGIARAMGGLGVSGELIVSSPFARARETAMIVAGHIGKPGRITLTDHLACDADPALLIAELRRLGRQRRSAIVVGHEPDLSRLISILLTGRPDLPLVLKKGGLVKLTLHGLRCGPCATLEWLMTGGQLRSLRSD